MENSKLIISKQDWQYIIILGGLFGFFISLCFYYINPDLQEYSTIIFCTFTALNISLQSSFFITLSNSKILPHIDMHYWYFISFLFSFASGFFGFLSSYYIFSLYDVALIGIIESYIYIISIVVGVLTFLIGLILHLFISMKYKHEETERLILKSQIKAYEDELNPHFLFNTLNSISELVYQDQAKAEEAILKVSKFLRGAIKSDSLIDIEKELDMVENYVDIENIRFANKINLSILRIDHIDKLIPKFSIQLLVENAIKHGYHGGVLDVDIVIEQSAIFVSNSGILPDDIVYGTGLSNLDNRLRLLDIGRLEYILDDKLTFIMEI
jgi:sensor histidine kinase YesM